MRRNKRLANYEVDTETFPSAAIATPEVEAATGYPSRTSLRTASSWAGTKFRVSVSYC